MEPKKAIQIIEDCLENNWLNLHEGQWDDEADEFEKAQKLTAIVPSDQIEWLNGLTKDQDTVLIDIAKLILDIAADWEGNHFLGYVVRKDT